MAPQRVRLMSATEVPTARELRGEIREWRRGRAELHWGEVLSDAYIALFCVVMVAAMGGNVVLSLRRLADDSCVGGCAEVRSVAPWLAVLAIALLALGLARLLGPVFSPPAANGWLLSTPVDRGALLRPGWARTVALTLAGAGLALLVPAALAGSGLAPAAGFVAAGAAAALTCVGIAALSQIHERRTARLLTWALTAVLWSVLTLSATQSLSALPRLPAGVGVALALLPVAVAVVLVLRARAAVAGLSRRVLAHTENLSPSLSGALSSVDLGLMYDVLLARRWGRGARVRTRTGGPLGWWALVHRDLLRAGRAPQPYVVLAGLVLVPYAAAEAGAGHAVVLVTTLVGLLGGPAACSGLRVAARSASLARMLPMSRSRLLLAHMVVPGTALALVALATTWTLLPTHPTGEALSVAVACGLSSLAATVRWVTGKPPDYAAPILSTMAGAVPTGVFSSVARGFDVWALTALPLMFSQIGLVVSMTISLGVIFYLISDEAG